MSNYNSIDDIVAGVENSTQVVTNTKYDDNSYMISSIPDFVKYKGVAISNIYANGNSWIGLGSSSEHFRFNRRDAAMFNLWVEEGTYLGNYSFFRVRWNGYSKHNAAGDPYMQTYDFIIFDTGDIMLYAVDIPTSYYNGTFNFDSVKYTKPTTENRYVTFYLQEDDTYSIEYEPIELSSPYEKRYLVKIGDNYYTEIDGALSQIAVTELTAQTFLDNGMLELPTGALLVSIDSPEVLCWTDAPDIQKIKGYVQGTPTGIHEIMSDNIRVGHYSIYGILGVDVVASSGVIFFVSIDGGSWMIYNSDSNSWVASDAGMSPTDLVNISEEAWSTLINSAENMKLKAVLSGVDTVTSVKFTFNNDAPKTLESEV